MLTIGVAGHRPPALGNLWHPRQWAPAVEYFKTYFTMMSGACPITVVSDLEPGASLIFAAGALGAKRTGAPVDLVAVVPYPSRPEQLKIALTRHWYDAALEKAERVIRISEVEPENRADAAGLEREGREKIVELSERIWVVWDGRNSGATFNTVLHARVQGRQFDNHWQAVARVLDLHPRVPRAAYGQAQPGWHEGPRRIQPVQTPRPTVAAEGYPSAYDSPLPLDLPREHKPNVAAELMQVYREVNG
jgi:hypothetical protein